MWATILAGTPLGTIEFALPARQGQAARPVRQAVFAKTLSLPDGASGQLSVTGLIAQEINAPAGCKPVEWRLLTNRAADSYSHLSPETLLNAAEAAANAAGFTVA